MEGHGVSILRAGRLPCGQAPAVVPGAVILHVPLANNGVTGAAGTREKANAAEVYDTGF